MRERGMSRVRGFTLIELLISMVLFLIVGLAASKFFISMSSAFRRGWQQTAVVQNLNFAQDLLPQHIRAAGAHVAQDQPALVYESPNVFAFNADYASNLPGDPFALYNVPDAPNEQVSSLPLAQRIAIPASNPLVGYPDRDYLDGGVPSAAETIILYFTPDSETARTDDWKLMRQVNDGTPEVLVRNVLPQAGVPFFTYWVMDTTSGGAPTLTAVPAARPPVLTYRDHSLATLLDSIRAVEVRFQVTTPEGTATVNSTPRPIRVYTALVNVGKATLRTCGDAPVFGQAVAAAVTGGATPSVRLTWNPSSDENAGQHDVVRYIVFRATPSTTWGEPFASVPATHQVSYTFSDNQVASGDQFLYAVVAQDCTPNLSPPSQTSTVSIP
jgi:prepilin-type N-terminal cleavage/methylation domain-containing protein